MKPSIPQTPRASSRRRSTRLEPSPGDAKVPKIAGKGSSSDLSPESEGSSTDRADPLDSSLDTSISVDSTPEDEDADVHGSSEIAGGCADPIGEEERVIVEGPVDVEEKVEVPAVATAVKKGTEIPVAADGVYAALLEMRRSGDVSDSSKRLLDALVDIAISRKGSCRRDGGWESILSPKVQIGVVLMLVGWAVLVNILAISVVFTGGSRDSQVFSPDLPPT